MDDFMELDPAELEKNSEKASRLMRALANEKRLLILCNLVGDEVSVQELQNRTGLGQSTVSQQLAILRNEDLVSARRSAQSVFYSIKSPVAQDILATLHAHFCRT